MSWLRWRTWVVRQIVAHWRGSIIAGFVAIQLLAPLHYYTLREDKNDERWAWRMFSPIRGLHCEPRFWVDGKPVGMGAPFHEAWWKIAQRGRLVVLEAMGARLCELHPQTAVKLVASCTTIDGREQVISENDLCKFPDL